MPGGQPEVRKCPTPGTGNIRKCPGVARGGDGHCWNWLMHNFIMNSVALENLVGVWIVDFMWKGKLLIYFVYVGFRVACERRRFSCCCFSPPKSFFSADRNDIRLAFALFCQNGNSNLSAKAENPMKPHVNVRLVNLWLAKTFVNPTKNCQNAVKRFSRIYPTHKWNGERFFTVACAFEKSLKFAWVRAIFDTDALKSTKTNRENYFEDFL